MKILKFCIITVVCVSIITGLLVVACSDDDKSTSPKQYGWAPLGTGTNNTVFSFAVYDNKLIAGGTFTTAGGVSANNIAAWDGSSWVPLGSGLNENGASGLAIYDGKLIAAGMFSTAGGVSANRIAA